MKNTERISGTGVMIWLVFMALVSCHPGTPAHENVSSGTGMRYSRYMRIIPGEGYHRLDLVNPWDEARLYASYFLDEGGLPDSLKTAGIPVIPVPVSRVAVTASPHVGMFSLLGKGNLIVGVDDKRNVYDSLLRHRIDEGKVRQVGTAGRLSVEEILALHPDVLLVSGFERNPTELLTIAEAGIPVVYTLGWMEQNPLGRAEWLKIAGYLTGKADEAKRIFDRVAERYTALCGMRDSLAPKPPQVLAGQMWKGTWYAPGGQSYFARLLGDAGIDYRWKDRKQTGSLMLDIEEVLARERGAEIWLYQGAAGSINEITEEDPRLQGIKAVRLGQVYGFYGKCNEAGVNAYWEEGYLNPDRILSDMLHVFYPQNFPGGEMHYIKPLTR